MTTRQVLCLALVAMTQAPAFGGLIKEAVVVGAVKAAFDKLQLADSSADAAVAANPSAPPTPTDTKTLLYGTTVDVDIKKVPIVTVSDAPCKNVCTNICKLDFKQSCKTVPVKSKECTPSKKTLTKKVCSKKCTLEVDTPVAPLPPVQPETPVSPPANPNPSSPPSYNPNPSSPPAYNPNPSAPVTYPNPSAPVWYPNPSAPVAYPNPSAPVWYPNPSAPMAAVVASAAEEAQLPSFDSRSDLQDVYDVSDDTDLSSSGRRLSGLVAKVAKAAVATELLKALPVPSCSKVCQDVHFEVPEIECKVVTHNIESCKPVPTKTCEEKCVCVPQKSVDINLPKKAVDISFEKEAVVADIKSHDV